jgi:glutathione synthase
MLLDGEPVAALGRRPAAGDFRANIAAGGEAFAVELSAKQEEIARHLGQELKRLGIVFAGLDFIGAKLIEINVTSPTLIQELKRVGGLDVSRRLLDIVEAGGV